MSLKEQLERIMAEQEVEKAKCQTVMVPIPVYKEAIRVRVSIDAFDDTHWIQSKGFMWYTIKDGQVIPHD